jgi:hypothetical protein
MKRSNSFIPGEWHLFIPIGHFANLVLGHHGDRGNMTLISLFKLPVSCDHFSEVECRSDGNGLFSDRWIAGALWR